MDHAMKLPNNVPGKYYVTDGCDGCAYCAAVAPDNFEFDKSTNTYFVGNQTSSPEEEELVREAMEDCPVDAIQSETPTINAEAVEHYDGTVRS
ncbi:MAG: ferredoxin [Ignavibacteria bacterium]